MRANVDIRIQEWNGAARQGLLFFDAVYHLVLIFSQEINHLNQFKAVLLSNTIDNINTIIF